MRSPTTKFNSAYSQTSMPRVRAWFHSGGWREPLLLAVLMLVATLAHGINMFNYPALDRLDDEGIYISQAWAILREGSLSPYTYWYDHAPAGWILIAGWMALTGGPLAFGTALESGRLLMLTLNVAMVPLLYFLARKLGSSTPFAALGVFLFSVSPLAITYQRMVLLDNIMLFWVLISLNLLLDGWGRLSRLILSGSIFGIAILTKETAIFLLPAILYLAFQQRWGHQGRFAFIAWLVPMIMVFSIYPLYAALKGELLPASSAIGYLLFSNEMASNIFSSETQVSLTESLKWQATRGGGGAFESGSMFYQLLRTNWLPLDPLLVMGGFLAILANLVRGFRNRLALANGLLGLFPLIYLGRGGVVFDFYILFAIPFLALNLSSLLTSFHKRIYERRIAYWVAGLISVTALGYVFLSGPARPLYQDSQEDPLREAVAWMKRNTNRDSRIILSDNLWTDLREPGFGGPAFTNAHSHWKVASDPEVYNTIFHNDWRTVDYIILTSGMREVLNNTGNDLALQALENSTLLQRWGNENTFAEIWKVNKPSPSERDLLEASHRYILRKFSANGAFYNSDGTVTSENQSYAMLRSVWMDDARQFYNIWNWTKANLMKDNGLLAWRWLDGEIQDHNSASDADTDVALALLFAGRRWNDPQLIEEGTRLAQALWEHTVVEVDGVPYLTAGEWATRGPVLALNPSYYSPYAYRIFHEVDPLNNWWDLIGSSYTVIFESSNLEDSQGEGAGLPPDWIGLEIDTGRLIPIDLPTVKTDTTRYGYDAARTYWRLALDYRYSEDGRAGTFLELAGFIRDEVERKGYPSAVYARDGQVLEENPSMVSIAGALAALLAHEPDLAYRLYADQIVTGADRQLNNTVTWGDPNDLYTQEWGWFATAFYADALPNLWWYIPDNLRSRR
jgi:endo-1,4-beta-D-glucanase Y